MQGITRDTLMMRMKPEQWQEVIDVNLSGVFYASQVGDRLCVTTRAGAGVKGNGLAMHLSGVSCASQPWCCTALAWLKLDSVVSVSCARRHVASHLCAWEACRRCCGRVA